ncbi:MAG: SET domain-containing protein [bacterium]
MARIYSILVVILFVALFNSAFTKTVYEKLTHNQIQENLVKFNKWVQEETNTINNPLFELRLTSDGQIGVFSTKDLNKEDLFFVFSTKLVLSAESIYTGKYTEFVKDIEKKYGYDELTYFVILLVEEYFNPNSHWRAYLDILPRIPLSPIHDYWNNSKWLEPELLGTTVLRKLVDYKISIEKKANSLVRGLFSKAPELFDPEIFNEDNVEWALNMIDTRLQTINYR